MQISFRGNYLITMSDDLKAKSLAYHIDELDGGRASLACTEPHSVHYVSGQDRRDKGFLIEHIPEILGNTDEAKEKVRKAVTKGFETSAIHIDLSA